jgi:RNA polymerase sigma factor (sigma-70 family)
MPAGSSRFPTTRRSAILATRSHDAAERRTAWDRVISAYWKPAYKYARLRWNQPPDQAEDLVQGFFTTALEKDWLDRYDPAKGSFRTWFRVCFDRHIGHEAESGRREKRGGASPPLPLDFAGAERELARQSQAVPGPEECFHREWQRQIFGLAVDDLRLAAGQSGKSVPFAIFSRYDLSEDRAGYDQLAAEFGIPVTSVTNYLAAMRRDLRWAVLARLREMTVDETEFRREARALLGGSK